LLATTASPLIARRHEAAPVLHRHKIFGLKKDSCNALPLSCGRLNNTDFAAAMLSKQCLIEKFNKQLTTNFNGFCSNNNQILREFLSECSRQAA